MINLFSRFLLIISFLILLPENSFAQNIFDDLKKAGEQIQKDLNKFVKK
jgi:DNA polymerase sigma